MNCLKKYLISSVTKYKENGCQIYLQEIERNLSGFFLYMVSVQMDSSIHTMAIRKSTQAYFTSKEGACDFVGKLVKVGIIPYDVVKAPAVSILGCGIDVISNIDMCPHIPESVDFEVTLFEKYRQEYRTVCVRAIPVVLEEAVRQYRVNFPNGRMRFIHYEQIQWNPNKGTSLYHMSTFEREILRD